MLPVRFAGSATENPAVGLGGDAHSCHSGPCPSSSRGQPDQIAFGVRLSNEDRQVGEVLSDCGVPAQRSGPEGATGPIQYLPGGRVGGGPNP